MFDAFLEDGSITRIELTFNSEKNSSLQENVEAIIKTIKVS